MISNCQLLIESLSDAILMLDKDGYIQYANSAVVTLTAYTSEELFNQPLYKLYASDEDSIRAEYELGTAARRGKFTVEGWKRKKDGSLFWAELTLCPILEKQKFTGFSCLLRDMSGET